MHIVLNPEGTQVLIWEDGRNVLDVLVNVVAMVWFAHRNQPCRAKELFCGDIGLQGLPQSGKHEQGSGIEFRVRHL